MSLAELCFPFLNGRAFSEGKEGGVSVLRLLVAPLKPGCIQSRSSLGEFKRIFAGKQNALTQREDDYWWEGGMSPSPFLPLPYPMCKETKTLQTRGKNQSIGKQECFNPQSLLTS